MTSASQSRSKTVKSVGTDGEQDLDRTLGRPCLTIRLPHGQRSTAIGSDSALVTSPRLPQLASKLQPDEAMRRSGVEKIPDEPPDPPRTLPAVDPGEGSGIRRGRGELG